MIYVDRKSVPAPRILKSGRMALSFEKAKEFYDRPLTARLQERHDFDLGFLKELMPALRQLFNEKCAYCESKLEAAQILDADQFRPKTGAINQDGKFDPDHYWWLTFEWWNSYLSCVRCNSSKGSRFPVEGRRVEVPKGGRAMLGAPWYVKDVLKEKPLLLDPCAENFDTEIHFVFDSKTGEMAGLTREGKVTIEIFALNRETLRTGRRKALESTVKLLEAGRLPLETVALKGRKLEVVQMLQEVQGAQNEFAAAHRQTIRRWLLERQKQFGGIAELERLGILFGKKDPELAKGKPAHPVLGEKHVRKIISTSRKKRKAHETRKTKHAGLEAQYITRIEIHNFRVIEDLVLTFPTLQDAEKSWMVLLGENGVGKSSVLKAVALALLNKEYYTAAKLKAERFLRVGSESGYVKVQVTGYSVPFEVHFDKKGFTKPNDNQLHTYLFGYGGTRLLPQSDHKPAVTKGVVRTENLFDPFLPLVDAKSWMLSLGRRSFGYSALALKDLLVRENEDRLFRRQGQIKLRLADFGTSVSLEELSDGYQSVVALTADILKVMLGTWPTAEKSQGVVMIDEIDVHLHPRWKIEIVNRLRRVFPRVQFIVTTHDPLCLLGTRPGEVHVLHRDAASERVVATQFDVPPGTRADQILTGFWFGLPSTLDRGTLKLLDDYYKLTRARQTTANKRRIHEFEAELRVRLGNFTDTAVDRMAQSVAAEILTGDYLSWDSTKREEKRAELKQKVARKLGKRRSEKRGADRKRSARKIVRRG